MYKKVFAYILAVFQILTFTSCLAQKNNFTEHDKAYLSDRYYEDKNHAYFGEREFYEDRIQLYDLCWYLENAAESKINTDNKTIKDDISGISECIYKLQHMIDIYDEIYNYYLICRIDRIADILTADERSEIITEILGMENDNGSFLDNKQMTEISRTFLALYCLDHLGYDIDKLSDTYIYLTEQYKTVSYKNVKDIQLIADILRSLSFYKLTDDHKLQIKNDLTEPIKDFTKIINSEDFYKNIFYYSTMLSNMCDLNELFDLNITYSDEFLSNLSSIISSEKFVDLDIQTKYELMRSYNLITNKTAAISDAFENEITAFFENKLYMGDISKTISSDYYGILSAEILDFKYDKNKVKTYIKSIDAGNLGIKEMYYYLKLFEHFSISPEKETAEKILKNLTSYQSEIKNNNRLLSVEVYYYIFEIYRLMGYGSEEQIESNITELLNNIPADDFTMEDYYFLSELSDSGIKRFENDEIIDAVKNMYDEENGGFKLSLHSDSVTISSTYYGDLLSEKYGIKHPNKYKYAEVMHNENVFKETSDSIGGIFETFYYGLKLVYN